MDAKRLADIRKKCEDAQFGFSGMRERDYARDVQALLSELDELRVIFEASAKSDHAREVECERLAQQVAHLEEVAELWKRDCDWSWSASAE